MERENAAWAAGLFDGEGYVGLSRNHAYRRQVSLSMGMVDRDLVERFCVAVGVGRVSVGRLRSSGRPFYTWRVGSFEGAQHVLASLWPWLGERRRARVAEVLGAVREAEAHRRYRRRAAA